MTRRTALIVSIVSHEDARHPWRVTLRTEQSTARYYATSRVHALRLAIAHLEREQAGDEMDPLEVQAAFDDQERAEREEEQARIWEGLADYHATDDRHDYRDDAAE